MTKEFSFVAVVHCDIGIFLYCGGSPQQSNFFPPAVANLDMVISHYLKQKKTIIIKQKGVVPQNVDKNPEKCVTKKNPALK